MPCFYDPLSLFAKPHQYSTHSIPFQFTILLYFYIRLYEKIYSDSLSVHSLFYMDKIESLQGKTTAFKIKEK